MAIASRSSGSRSTSAMACTRAPAVRSLDTASAQKGTAPRTVTPLDPSTAGTITGTVTFAGPPPAMKPVALGGDPQCAIQHQGPVLAGDALVHDGKVENAFVYVKDGLGARTFAVPETPVTINQAGCLYQPHVAGAQTCQ